MNHELKTWPEHFEDVIAGHKTFERRLGDRGFRVGDTLHLREWAPTGGYTGRVCRVDVTHISYGGRWGLAPEFVEMSISPSWGDQGVVPIEAGLYDMQAENNRLFDGFWTAVICSDGLINLMSINGVFVEQGFDAEAFSGCRFRPRWGMEVPK